MVSQANPAQGAKDSTVTLARCGSRDAGHALALRRGDVLVGVDGTPWRGSADALGARLSGAERPLALSFLRGDVLFSVLSDRADLGLWDSAPVPPGPHALPQGTARLGNWVILQGPDERFEPVDSRHSLLALAFPALWLAQMRMWTWLATLAAALVVALAGGPLLVAVVWMASGIHLWRNGAAHLLADRHAAGFVRAGVLAAASENEARAIWSRLSPGARFRFDPAQAAPAAPETSAATAA
jgi:hypothetical protein